MEPESRLAYYDERYNLQIPLVEIDNVGLCPYVIPEGEWSTRVAGYHGILEDLQECRGVIDYLLYADGIQHIVATSMFKAFIIQYGRCYSDNTVRRLKLESNEVFKRQDTRIKQIHEKIATMRGYYIAHASDKHYESGAMVLYLNPDPQDKQVIKSLFANLRYMDPSELLEDCLELVTYVTNHINEKLSKIEKYYDEEVAQFDLELLYTNSFLPDIDDCKPLYSVDLMGE